MLPDDPSNIGNYFKDFVSRVAEGDDAYTSSADKADIWIRQYGAGKDVSKKLANIGGLYREKYIQPATQRFKNLSLAQAPTDDDVTVRHGGATQNFEQKLIKPAEMADTHLKNRANLPEMFTKPFIERNLLYSQDPVTAGIRGAGEMLRSAPRGIAGGAALSALSPDVAQSVEQGQYGKAATQTAQNVAGGALADLGIQATGWGLQRAAPQLASKVIPAFSGAANVGVPAAVGTGLFMQGQQGSPLNRIVNAASNTPFGLKVNPKTDVGRIAGRAIGNEAQYAWNQIRQGKMPWMGR
jgi:hypothetical protein